MPVLADARLARAVAGECQGLQGALRVAVAGEQRHLRAMRRQAGALAFVVEAAGGVFVGCVQHGEDGVLWLAGLYPNLAFAFASGAAADLYQ